MYEFKEYFRIREGWWPFGKKAKETDISSSDEVNHRANEYRHMIKQLKKNLGIDYIEEDLSQDATLRQRALANPNYLEYAFRILSTAFNHANQIGFSDGIAFLERKRRELEKVRQELLFHRTKQKVIGTAKNKAEVPEKHGSYPMPTADPELAKGAREIYVLKATRVGMDDSEIIASLMQNYNVKTAPAAKRLISSIRLADRTKVD